MYPHGCRCTLEKHPDDSIHAGKCKSYLDLPCDQEASLMILIQKGERMMILKCTKRSANFVKIVVLYSLLARLTHWRHSSSSPQRGARMRQSERVQAESTMTTTSTSAISFWHPFKLKWIMNYYSEIFLKWVEKLWLPSFMFTIQLVLCWGFFNPFSRTKNNNTFTKILQTDWSEWFGCYAKLLSFGFISTFQCTGERFYICVSDNNWRNARNENYIYKVRSHL